MIKILSFIFFLLMPLQVSAFEDNFDFFNESKWSKSSWRSSHAGFYSENNVSIVNGYLRLKMIQYFNGIEFVSYGGEISSLQNFSYGAFEFRMRSSSTAEMPNDKGSKLEGSVSAGFLYAEKAVTEIDIEFEGTNNKTHLISWIGETQKNEHTSLNLEGRHDREFYIYKFVWYPDRIEYYRDNVLVATHTKKIPSSPAKMFFNHWGTHSKWWGGFATPDVPRYVYIDWFKYTPLEE